VEPVVQQKQKPTPNIEPLEPVTTNKKKQQKKE
jgi:hypothetical protein